MALREAVGVAIASALALRCSMPVEPPTVFLASPASGDTVGERILLAAAVDEPTGATVTFYANGVPVGEVSGPPFETTFVVDTLLDYDGPSFEGRYVTLQARARNAAGSATTPEAAVFLVKASDTVYVTDTVILPIMGWSGTAATVRLPQRPPYYHISYARVGVSAYGPDLSSIKMWLWADRVPSPVLLRDTGSWGGGDTLYLDKHIRAAEGAALGDSWTLHAMDYTSPEGDNTLFWWSVFLILKAPVAAWPD